jgi:hypothetical protein
MDPNKLKSALISGPVSGFVVGVAAVIPIVSTFNCCCCPILAVGSGFGSAALLNKFRGGQGITPVDGLTVGAISGGMAALVYGIFALVGQLIWGAVSMATMPDDVTQTLPPAVIAMLSGAVLILVGAVLVAILSAAGGAIGGAIFKPVTPPPPPPPPGGGTPFGSPYGQQGPFGGQPF